MASFQFRSFPDNFPISTNHNNHDNNSWDDSINLIEELSLAEMSGDNWGFANSCGAPPAGFNLATGSTCAPLQTMLQMDSEHCLDHFHQIEALLSCSFFDPPSLVQCNSASPRFADPNYSSDSGGTANYSAPTPPAANYESPSAIISCRPGHGFPETAGSTMVMAACSSDAISSCITAAPSSPLMTNSISNVNPYLQQLSPAPVDMPAAQQDVSTSLIKKQNPNRNPIRASAKGSASGRPTQRRIRTETIRVERAPANRQINFGSAESLSLLFTDSNGMDQGPGGAINDDNNGADPPTVSLRVATDSISLMDGYTWKKYGEKKIKNRSYPRSYFKCAHNGCQITKRTQRDTHNEVIFTYIGRHNHHP